MFVHSARTVHDDRLALDSGQSLREECVATFALQDTTDDGSFKGMASVFGTLIDAYIPTRILPGAFTTTLREDANRVRILYQHNQWDPIGKPSKLEETALGLYIEGEVVDTAVGVDALKLMRKGIIDELSIGFDPTRWEMVDDGKGNVERHISELKLWEVSLVTFGANRDAKIMSVHALAASLPMETQALVRPLLEQFHTHHADNVPEAAEAMARALAVSELHEGKVLSSGNKTLVKQAIAALQKLVDAAEKQSIDLGPVPPFIGDLDVHELELQLALT